MIKEKMTIGRDEKEVNVYKGLIGKETYCITLYKGEPILVEVNENSGYYNVKTKPHQNEFLHAVQVCMCKILESDLEEFRLLGEDLYPGSIYFREFENTIKDELVNILDRKSILEGMLEVLTSSNS